MDVAAEIAAAHAVVWGAADDGAVIEVTVPAGAADRLTACWPPHGLARHDDALGSPVRRVALRSGPAGTLRNEVDGAPTFGGWERIESELALFAAERLAGRVAVHAAAIAWNGRVLLVPSPSGCGKSRLCAAAAEAGATVLSDEYAVVDLATGLVTSWPHAVRVRRGDGVVQRLDIARTSEPLPVGLVAAVRYQPGATTTLEAMSGADTTMTLLANIVCAQSRPDDAFDATLAIARSAPGVHSVRGDATTAVGLLLDRIDAPAQEPNQP